MTSKKRIAVVDNEKFKDLQEKKHVQNVCPVNRSGTECISIDEQGKLWIDEETCISCMLCVKAAPHAVSVVNLPSELKEFPIHRYGKNMFALYKLPIPKKGMVVGLLGQNGIGKSTVIKILSGNQKPNCDLLDREPSWEEIIAKFKGTELQDYLTNIKNIKVAYKPQDVDKIQRALKGKVGELLEKISKEKFRKVVKDLDMERLLEKDIKDLSGGELQLFAIAATIIKGGSLYFFDEPTSYLDVEQRLKVSKVIRSLEGYVMVIEHDLAIADYLADQVHILYGTPGVFGVVSSPYGVRVGVNAYLEGYLKEENMRFRRESISFSKVARASEKNKKLLEFGAFSKKFPGFSLKTNAGELYKGELVGILGPNGIGKTTFVKMLAGELKPDQGEGLDLKLSYKEQRLELKKDEKSLLVSEFISNLNRVKKVNNLLGVDRFLDREMVSLSGGELQAVFISAALSRDHDILLFDEPSAFLDVEQRLKLVKLLKEWVEEKNIAGFVVDHDLQVIDALSNRVMIFEGEPGKKGVGDAPCEIKDGMNKFLKTLGITFRRDPQTGRPRANKLGSVLDREQKEKGQYYYS